MSDLSVTADVRPLLSCRHVTPSAANEPNQSTKSRLYIYIYIERFQNRNQKVYDIYLKKKLLYFFFTFFYSLTPSDVIPTFVTHSYASTKRQCALGHSVSAEMR